MALANREATTLNHDYLAPAHVMLGLIAEGQCVATETLRVLDVDIDKVRDEIRAQLGQGQGQGAVGRRAQTKETKTVIEQAIQEARKFGHRYIGTEHLLMDLLQQADDKPAKVLRTQGLEVDALREKALALMRATVDASHDLSHSRHGDFVWVHQQELAKAFRSTDFWHTMILAVDSANRLGAGEVGPTHLLLALLRDPSNGIAALLADKGVTADWVREKIASSQNNAE